MTFHSDHSVLMTVLRTALSLKRPHGSIEEGMLIGYIMQPPFVIPGRPAWVDTAGNLHIDNRNGSGSKTLFVAHVDTVHSDGGVNTIDTSTSIWKALGEETQAVHPGSGKPLYRNDGSGRFIPAMFRRGEPLGADDGAGVAMLAALLAVDVPGYYIFSRGEERGCLGSKHIAREHKDVLKQFNRAITFDRKGTGSVITHQSPGRTCSDTFGKALATALCGFGLKYQTDPTGIYTDTAHYIDHIAECTNISVGYTDAHSANEWLDTDHLKHLFDAASKLNWEALPTERKPGSHEPRYGSTYTSRGHSSRGEFDYDGFGFGGEWYGRHIAGTDHKTKSGGGYKRGSKRKHIADVGELGYVTPQGTANRSVALPSGGAPAPASPPHAVAAAALFQRPRNASLVWSALTGAVEYITGRKQDDDPHAIAARAAEEAQDTIPAGIEGPQQPPAVEVGAPPDHTFTRRDMGLLDDDLIDANLNDPFYVNDNPHYRGGSK